MFKLDDLNPLFKPPSALVKPSYGLEGSQAGNSNPPFDERQLTETNYYKLATTSKINCYFYQVQDFPTAQRSSLAPTTSPTDSKQGSSNGTSDANASPLQQIHTYDSIIKAKLASDYSIRDTITYVAKREICIFQMEIREHDANSDIGFNQLKDAIDNIINENKIHLKLVSATRFDSNAVLKQLPPQPANRPINIIYLSFLRAVKKYITLRLTKVHRLPDTSVDILPFGNQMIVSSTVEKPTEGSTCKQLNDGSYSILKMSPSLGFRNDLMLNISMSNSLKLYKLSEFLNTESFMDRKDYVIYICPSGVRCLCAINNSLADSITDEAPINYDRLVKLLEQHTTINLPFNDPNRKPPICRKWIKLIPNINHMNGLTPKISKYLESFILNTKYIMWPVELCFVQFSADSAKFQTTPLPKSRGDNGLEIENPLALIEDFIDLCGDIEAELSDKKAAESEALQLKEPENKNNEEHSNFTDFKVDDNEGDISMVDGQLQHDSADISMTNWMTANNDSVIDNGLEEQPKLSIEPIDIEIEANSDSIARELLQTDSVMEDVAQTSPAADVENEDDDWDELFGGEAEEGADVLEEDHEGGVNQRNQIGNGSGDEHADAQETTHNSNDADADLFGSTSTDDESHKGDEKLDAVQEVRSSDREDNDEGSAANQLKSNSTDAPSNSKDLTPFPGAVLYNPVTNPLYEDPGAPSPISFQIFAPSTPPNETPATSIDENKAFTPKDANKSIFAPLNFNPLIEKDIDSKYSNGGKFFVKNGTESPILALPTKDSMSASATTPTFWRTGNLPSKRKFGESTFEDKATNSDLISDSDDEDDEDGEVDEDQDDDDDDDDDDDEEEEEREEEENSEENFNESGLKAESLSNELDVRPDDSNHGLGLGIASGGPVNSSFMNGGLSTTLGNTGILSSAASSMTPNISSAVFSSNTVAVPSPVTTSLTQDANEIQNWLYWILRGPSTSTIPTYFLSVSNPHISPDKLASILPILQELILFSPLDICTKDLSIMSRNRENPSMLNPEVESVMDSVFPGISKMKLHEILECSKQIEAAVPFECLFRSDKNNSKIDKQHNQSQLIKQEPAARLEFDDPSFATTSPLMNMNSNPELETRRNASVSRDSNAVTNKMIAESTSSNSLFRVPSTIINSKRLDHDLKINQASLNFWKILNLQPVMGMKDFEVLFIVPKTFEFFRQKSIDFMDSVIDSYKDCKLGTIKKLKVDAVDLDGLLEIEATSEAEFWANIDIQLNEVAKNFQDEFISSKKTYTNPILLLFATPFTDLISIVKMSSAINTFNMTLTEKIIEQEPPSDEDKRKKRKKSTVQSKIMLPINVFHKALPMELYFSQAGSFSVCSDQQLVDLALKLYNLCPTTQASREMKKSISNTSNPGNPALRGDRFKDRDPFFTVAKDLPSKIFFMLTKTPIAKNLISDELFLHVCYERSIDKNWCVASWTDQYGSINYIKSWYTNAEIKGSKSFEQVSNEIMEITLDYTSTHNGKSYVILTRLSNMIPDDELTEWKRLSVQNNKLTLIVLTVELEPSTLILSHHQNATQSSKKDDIKEFYSVRYTVGSTNSQMPTPNFASSVNNKMESPEINNSMQTPSYDLITSPIDSASMMTGHHYAGSHNLQSNGVNAENQVLIELSDECYGVILQMAQPLSNQSIRLPLKTGFLINASGSGSGSTGNGKSLEINLLSCQSGINSIELLKKIIIQFKNLSLLTAYYDLAPLARSGEITESEGNVGPWHILAVKKMLDLLVHVRVE